MVIEEGFELGLGLKLRQDHGALEGKVQHGELAEHRRMPWLASGFIERGVIEMDLLRERKEVS